MSLSRFFIDRPIFAWVLAIGMMIAGGLAILTLPSAQYPDIAPPSVLIMADYPGASADTLENTVTQVIEQQMNGIDHLRYMESSSESTGAVRITLTFEQGTDPDVAQVQVQNKLQLAIPKLPEEVQRQGLAVFKSTINFLAILAIYSDNPEWTTADLGDLAATRLQDQLSRVPGIGESAVMGAQYAMRVWLNPHSLKTYRLTPTDVKAAIRAQNSQISIGEVGGAPAVKDQQLVAQVMGRSRLQTAEEFQNILLRTNPDGSTVRLADVARVEIGQENYLFDAHYNRKPAVGMFVRLAPGANVLETRAALDKELAKLLRTFPDDVHVAFNYDTAPVVRESINEVVKTLVEAIILVFLVMFLFLQKFRATLIPTLAVPVVLLGTMGILALFGFSINTLTLFGLVLAIGLLVDDAIVVVENVERLMEEEGLSPKEATRKSMDEISSALVAIGVVLSAVFIPMAFFPGSTGVIYRQFSITIVSAMGLSVLVALIFTPALCATLLKPITGEPPRFGRRFFTAFNRWFHRTSDSYESSVKKIMGRGRLAAIVYAVLLGVLFAGIFGLPTSYFPDEDQGTLFVMVERPAGSTIDQTNEVSDEVVRYLLENEKDLIKDAFAVNGFSPFGRGQNVAQVILHMKSWKDRVGEDITDAGLAMRINRFAAANIRDAVVIAFPPPAVVELGNAKGFQFELLNSTGLDRDTFIAARNQLVMLASQDPALINVRPNVTSEMPRLRVETDDTAAGAFGISVEAINDTISTAWGGSYVNDFVDRGRVKKVFVQGDAPFRSQPDDLNDWHVRGASGEMAPFSAFGSSHWDFGPTRLERFNGLPSYRILGEQAPGKSTGDAMRAMEQIVEQLPEGVSYRWSGLSYEEEAAGNQTIYLYSLSMLFVFLCLAALYESWSVPLAVLSAAPLGVLGSVIFAYLFGLNNDIYFQVGLITIIGLAAKNAILIVEFAEAERQKGRPLVEAAAHAARLRLRPILMTSFAFVGGVLPLAFATGAGAGARRAIGTAVVGGMISASFLVILLVPLAFVIVSWLFHRKPDAPETVGGEA